MVVPTLTPRSTVRRGGGGGFVAFAQLYYKEQVSMTFIGRDGGSPEAKLDAKAADGTTRPSLSS